MLLSSCNFSALAQEDKKRRLQQLKDVVQRCSLEQSRRMRGQALDVAKMGYDT
jgi:tRNA A37 methylthiotransferase MiaB